MAKHALKILSCEHRKIFKVYLTIFQHRRWKGSNTVIKQKNQFFLWLLLKLHTDKRIKVFKIEPSKNFRTQPLKIFELQGYLPQFLLAPFLNTSIQMQYNPLERAVDCGTLAIVNAIDTLTHKKKYVIKHFVTCSQNNTSMSFLKYKTTNEQKWTRRNTEERNY